jgi:glutaredoxin-related protein
VDNSARGRIERENGRHDVVLFMKDRPVFLQNGSSDLAVQLLSRLSVKREGIDVLSDPALPQGIKAFSEWPSVPRHCASREFVGGTDIIGECTCRESSPSFLPPATGGGPPPWLEAQV